MPLPVCVLPAALAELLPYFAVAVLLSCALNPYCREVISDLNDQVQQGLLAFGQYVTSGIAAIQGLLSTSTKHRAPSTEHRAPRVVVNW